jgi:glucose-1-phosphate thymidylyltransferase
VKALVPSGGTGSRLRPITHTSAKQLIPVANKPILDYVLRDIVAAGVTDIGIVTGDTGAEIEAFAGDGARWGARVSYLPQDAPRGLAHTVLIARDYLGDEPFIMYLGDNILRDGVAAFVREFERERPAAQILTVRVADPRRYGNVEMDGDRVARLVEKPQEPQSALALAGVYLFDARVHDAVRAIQPSARGELEITEAIQWLVDRGEPVRAVEAEGWWKDTGRVEDLLDANRLVLESTEASVRGDVDEASSVTGAVVVEPGARIENSTLRGPLCVGAGTVVRDSFVGPFTSIGPNCVVEDSELEHSVILEGCRLTGVQRLEDSLLGRDVVVERTDRKPKSYRLVVGDHGEVGIV